MNKKKSSKKNYFEVVFISVSIVLFFVLIFSISWLKNSLYEARDQVALEFFQEHEDSLMGESVDPFVSVRDRNSLLLSPIDNGRDPSLGSSSAKVNIFYFSDFSCPFCWEQEKALKNIYDNFKQDVRIIWKDYPDFEPESFSYQAARAARCAHEQGRFWDYNELLYEFKSSFPDLREGLFLNLAGKIKLNIDNFTSCWESNRSDDAIISNILEAEDLGVVGIPYIYINETEVLGGLNQAELEEAINIELDN